MDGPMCRPGSREPYNCIVLLGPPAVGKTALAVSMALRLGGEILSADSRQVYRGLDIGSGKDLCEFTVTEQDGSTRSVPYHLIDITDLTVEYNVFSYQRDFYRAFGDVRSRRKLPVIVGGTGMYLDAIVRGYEMTEVPDDAELREKLSGLSMEELGALLLRIKPDLHNRSDLTERPRLVRAIEIETYKSRSLPGKTAVRPDIRPLVLGTTFDRGTLRRRIASRLRRRFSAGLTEEVAALHEGRNGLPPASWERLERLGLEYRFVAEYLQGRIPDKDELFRKLNTAIGQFAKRQETWFRGMERKGVVIHWIPQGNGTDEERLEQAFRIIGAADFSV